MKSDTDISDKHITSLQKCIRDGSMDERIKGQKEGGRDVNVWMNSYSL